MSVVTCIKNFILMNIMTVYYCIPVLFIFFMAWLKNPFSNPWALKLRLVPPANLTDPKFGAHKYIKVNHIKLHYVESGDPSKPMMLFLHGFPEFWYSWRHQIVEFQKDYWCIAVDMRGYGDSERPEKQSAYEIEELVEDVRDLIRQLGRQKCIIVSHDWGGLISCRFRDVHPEVVQALIVLGSTSREAWFYEMEHNKKQLKKSWYVFFYRAPIIPELLLQLNNLEIFDKFMLVKGKDTITVQDIECYKYWFGKQEAFTPPINYYRANVQYAPLPPTEYNEENIPFLVVLGENDDFIEPSLLDAMKKQYAHIETKILNNCGHFLQQEEPVKVNKFMRDFLAKHKC